MFDGVQELNDTGMLGSFFVVGLLGSVMICIFETNPHVR